MRMVPPTTEAAESELDYDGDTLQLGGAVYEKDGNGEFTVDLVEHVDILKKAGWKMIDDPTPAPTAEDVEKAAQPPPDPDAPVPPPPPPSPDDDEKTSKPKHTKY